MAPRGTKLEVFWATASWWVLLAGRGTISGQEVKLQAKCDVFKTVLII